MENIAAVERFDQAHGAKIEKLFWIAGSIQSSDLEEVLEGFDDKDWEEVFPDIHQSGYLEGYIKDGELAQALVDHRLFGLLAEIHLPECRNFSYRDGKPVSWSLYSGISRVRYIYAEMLEGLMAQVEKVSEEEFQKFIEKDNLKKAAKN